jgi:hypothetical protein
VTGVILILAIAIDRLQQTPGTGGRLRGFRGFGHGRTSTSEPTLEEGTTK